MNLPYHASCTPPQLRTRTEEHHHSQLGRYAHFKLGHCSVLKLKYSTTLEGTDTRCKIDVTRDNMTTILRLLSTSLSRHRYSDHFALVVISTVSSSGLPFIKRLLSCVQLFNLFYYQLCLVSKCGEVYVHSRLGLVSIALLFSDHGMLNTLYTENYSEMPQ